MSIPIMELPPDQRPRERLLTHGPRVLTNAELLALLLRSGRAGESALELANALLADYDGPRGLIDARPEELARRAGIGEVKAAGLVAAFHFADRARCAPAPPLTRLSDPEDIAEFTRPMFAGLRTEQLVVVVCDARDRVRQQLVVATGGQDRLVFPIREILNVVLRNDGRGFALAHNHPSGDPKPSPADRDATDAIEDAAARVGLRYLDHVIVTSDGWCSIGAEEWGG